MINYFVLFLLPFFLTSIDILSYFLFEHFFCHFLLTFLIAYYWYRNATWLWWIGLFLLSIESFIIYQSVYLYLLAAIPNFLLIKALKNRVYLTPLQPVITLTIALLIDILILQGFYKGIQPPLNYTVEAFFGNILLAMIFSLKLSGGKTRQSLMPLA